MQMLQELIARLPIWRPTLHQLPGVHLQLPGVWCLVFGVWCLVSGVWCLVVYIHCLKGRLFLDLPLFLVSEI